MLSACASFRYKETGTYVSSDGNLKRQTTTVTQVTSDGTEDITKTQELDPTVSEVLTTKNVPTGGLSAGGGNNLSFGEMTLADGGENFTVVSWNNTDMPALLNAWIGNDDGVSLDYMYNVERLDGARTPNGVPINFVNLECGSFDAKQAYDNMLAGGEDIDIYCVEPDYLREYADYDTKSAPMSSLGFSDDMWSDSFEYVQNIGRNGNGELRAISWQACPGGYAYRTDMAESYLGVTSPEEMQTLVCDWGTMEQTAAKVYEASSGQTAMAATVAGMGLAAGSYNGSFTENGWIFEGTLNAYDNKALSFLEMAKHWTDSGYVTSAYQWGDEWYRLGVENKTMGYFVATWGFDIILGGDYYTDPTGASTAIPPTQQWAVVQGPSLFYWGGTWMLVNSRTDNGTDCRDFIAATTLDTETMTLIAESRGDFVNNKTIVQTTYNQPKSLGGQDYFPVLADVASKIDIDYTKVSPYDSTISSEFMVAVSDYAYGLIETSDKTVESFMDRVAERVPQVTIESNYD